MTMPLYGDIAEVRFKEGCVMGIKSVITKLRKITRIGALLLFASVLIAPFSVSTMVAAEGTGQITGNIYQDNGAPIPSATVKAYASAQEYYSGNAAAVTTSAGDGSYTLSGLPDGDYLILANDFNDPNSNHNFSWAFYTPQGRSNDRPETISARVAVSGGNVVNGIEIYLLPGGEITGHVKDSSNQPLAGIKVAANRSDLMNDPNELPVTARTDANGFYRLQEVSAGVWDLSVHFNTDNASYQQQWYNASGNATVYDNAGGIPVAQGQTVENIDAQLPNAGKITGHLTDNLGNPLAGISVWLYPESWDGSTPQQASYVTDSTGYYEFTNLTVGSYNVQYNNTYSDTYNADYSTDVWYNAKQFPTPNDLVPVVTAGNTVADTSLNLLLNGLFSVTSSLSTSHVGQAVTFTATVPNQPNPGTDFTGMVVWTDNGNLIWGENCPFTTSINGVATCTATFTTPGVHTIQANWHGNMFYKPNTTTISQMVIGNAPTSKDQCKKGGWKNFTDPVFKNQGQCVSYVEHH
jgi:hypothetical protein